MSEFSALLLVIGFVVGVMIYVLHQQYMAGHDAFLFSHKTDEEIRIREAQVSYQENHAESIKLDNTIKKERLKNGHFY